MPAPGAVSTTIPKSAPKTVRSRSSTLARPMPPLRPARLERSSCGSIPTPSSSTVMWASGPASVATMLMWPWPGFFSRPWRTAFSTSGWSTNTGTATGSTSGATWRVTWSRSPNRARSSTRYLSIDRSSSARVVNWPWLRKL